MNNQKLTIDQINAQYGKIPPQAIDVEEAVLGALILENDAFDKISDILTPKSFYRDEHQKLFNEIELLHKADKRTDLMIITNELKNKGLLDHLHKGGSLEAYRKHTTAPVVVNAGSSDAMLQTLRAMNDKMQRIPEFTSHRSAVELEVGFDSYLYEQDRRKSHIRRMR